MNYHLHITESGAHPLLMSLIPSMALSGLPWHVIVYGNVGDDADLRRVIERYRVQMLPSSAARPDSDSAETVFITCEITDTHHIALLHRTVGNAHHFHVGNQLTSTLDDADAWDQLATLEYPHASPHARVLHAAIAARLVSSFKASIFSSSEQAKPTSDLRVRLERLLIQTLRLPSGTDLSQAAMGRTQGWDSLSHISLLLAVEKEFDISLPAQVIAKTHSLDDITHLIAKREAA